MLTFTPVGRRLPVANEGEPNSHGQADSVDPEGSISVITADRGGTPTVATAGFRAWIGQAAALCAQGVRIFGPGATAAQDLEPEHIAVSGDRRTACVTLQENNAAAIADVATAKVATLESPGRKNHNLAGMGLDASDEDGGSHTHSGTPAVRIETDPVRGLDQPDAITSNTFGGRTFLPTATPNGKPLLIVGHEVSAIMTVLQIDLV